MSAKRKDIVNCRLLDELENLLQKQVPMVRRGNFRRVEALSEQAGAIVEKIVKRQVPGRPESQARRKRLVKLYQQLTLMVASQKELVHKQLRQIRDGKKTLDVYRGNA